MDVTRRSLLLRVKAGEADAWKDLTDLYRPLIVGLTGRGVPPGDVDDLSQDVLPSVVKHLPGLDTPAGGAPSARGCARSCAAAPPTPGGRPTKARGRKAAAAPRPCCTPSPTPTPS